MQMVRKIRKHNVSTRQKFNTATSRKQVKMFRKILIYENKSWENYGKIGQLTFENLDLVFLSFVVLFICFKKL